MKHLLKCLYGILFFMGWVSTGVAQDYYWPLDNNNRFFTILDTSYPVTPPKIPTSPYPTVFSYHGEVLFTNSGGLALPYYPFIQYLNFFNDGVHQIFPIPGACKRYGVLSQGYVAVPHGHFINMRIVDASMVINDANNTPIPSINSGVGISSGANALYYGSGVAPMNDDGTRYLYHLNVMSGPFNTVLYRRTIDYNGNVSSATTIHSGLVNPRSGGTIIKTSRDGKTIAYFSLSGKLVTYNTVSGIVTEYPEVFAAAHQNSNFIEQVDVGNQRRWYFSSGNRVGYYVESNTTLTTVSTTLGLNSSIALSKSGRLYLAHGTGGPGLLVSFDPTTTNSIGYTFPFLFGAIPHYNSNATYLGGVYSFGNHVAGEDMSSFMTAPSGTKFRINGSNPSPTVALNVCRLNPITLTRVRDYHNYRILFTVAGNPNSHYFNSGLQRGRLPESVDLRNLCHLPGWSGNCTVMNTFTGQMDVRVIFYSGCDGTSDTTVARINVIPGAVTSMPLTVNNLSGAQTFTLCNGSTNLILRGTPNRDITQYSVTLQKGIMSGSTFIAQGTSATTGNINSNSFADRNLHTIGSGYINGYNGVLKITVITTNPCGSFTSEQIITIFREQSMGTLSYTLNGKSNGADPVDMLMCDNKNPLTLTPSISGSVYTYDVEITRGSWSSGVFYPSHPSVTATNIPKASMPLDLAAHPTIGAGIMAGIPGVVRVKVTANGPCSPATVTRTQVYRFAYELSNSNLAFELNSLPNSGSVVDVIKCNNDKVLELDATVDGTAPSYFTVTVQKGEPDGNNDFTPTEPPQSNTTSSWPIDLADKFAGYLVDNNNLYEGWLRVNVTTHGNCSPTDLDQVYNIQNRTSIDQFAYKLKGQDNDVNPVDIWLCGTDNSLSLLPSLNGDVASYTIQAQKGEFSGGGYFAPVGAPEQQTVNAGDMPVDLSDLFDYYLLDGNGDVDAEGLKLTITATGPCNAPVKEQIYKFHRGDHAMNLAYQLNGEHQSANTVDIWLCGTANALELDPTADGNVTGYHIKVEKGSPDPVTGDFISDNTSEENSFTSTPVDLVTAFPTYLNNGGIYEGLLKVTVTTEGPCNPESEAQVYRIRKGAHNTSLTYTLNNRENETDSIRIWMCENEAILALNPDPDGEVLGYRIKLQKGDIDTMGNFGAVGMHEEKTVANTGNPIDLGSEFSAYLNAGLYEGGLEVTVTTEGPCNNTDKVQIYDIIRAYDNDSLAFNLNAQHNNDDPVLIALCDSSEMLEIDAHPGGTALKYSVQVIRGDFNPITGDFEPETGSGVSLDMDASEFPANLTAKFPGYLRPGGALFTNAGLYVKLTTHGPCQNAIKEQVYRIKRGSSTSNLSYTLNTQANDTGAVAIWLCNGADELNLNPSANGSVDSYFVKVEKGTYTGGSFIVDGTSDSVKVHASATPVELYAAFGVYLNAGTYEGGLKVTVKTRGLCNSVAKEQVYEIGSGNSITSLSYELNGFANNVVPPVIWLCNQDSVLKLVPSASGTVTDYIIQVQKGTLSGGNFTLNDTSATKVFGHFDTLDLVASFPAYLKAGGTPYYGALKVKITANGPCPNSNNVIEQVYDVRSATAVVDFLMKGPGTCADQLRYTSTTFTPLGVVPPGPAPCHNGWLGANSAGISGYNIIATTAITQYRVLVQELDTLFNPVADIIDYIEPGNIAPYSNFNYLYSIDPAHYGDEFFRDDYNRIKGKVVFKVVATVTTQECGNVSDSSYFKIIDGVTGKSYKPSGIQTVDLEMGEIEVYPNPSVDIVNFEISNYSDDMSRIATLIVTDISGKVIVSEQIQNFNGKCSYNFANFANGVYLFKLNAGEATYIGRFTKR